MAWPSMLDELAHEILDSLDDLIDLTVRTDSLVQAGRLARGANWSRQASYLLAARGTVSSGRKVGKRKKS